MAGMAEFIAGVPMREPFKSELDYFRKNPSVAGMATEDNKVIINPFTKISDQQKQAVALNEAARVWMRTKKDYAPDFTLTKQQEQFLDTTTYRNAPAAERLATIAARLLSNDTSAGVPTAEQNLFVARLKMAMFGNE
jgi:hypothetical protein